IRRLPFSALSSWFSLLSSAALPPRPPTDGATPSPPLPLLVPPPSPPADLVQWTNVRLDVPLVLLLVVQSALKAWLRPAEFESSPAPCLPVTDVLDSPSVPATDAYGTWSWLTELMKLCGSWQLMDSLWITLL
ncbi:Os04g0510150, partial [Oryza sativa Japonica Group]